MLPAALALASPLLLAPPAIQVPGGGRVDPSPCDTSTPRGGPGTEVTPIPEPPVTGLPAIPVGTARTPPSPPLLSRQDGATAGTLALLANDGTSAWEWWWALHQDEFLVPRLAAVERVVTPGGDGAPRGLPASGRATVARSDPALLEVLGSATAARLPATLRRGARAGLSRACTLSGEDLDPLRGALRASPGEAAEAIVELGLVAGPDALQDLADLLRDNARGRALAGRPGGVPPRFQVAAAVGLGALACGLERQDALRGYVAHLLLDSAAAPSAWADVPAAALAALGATRPPDAEALARELMGLLRRPKRDPRAVAPGYTTLARLLEGVPAESPELRAAVGLCRSALLDRGAAAPRRQAAATALGTLLRVRGQGEEARDGVRLLIRMVEDDPDHGVRRLSLMALAEAGGRAGCAAAVTGGEILPFLLETASTGDSTLRPWAALAVGVLHFRAIECGRIGTPGVAGRRLQELLRKRRTASERAALALALGLLRHRPAIESLRGMLLGSRDPRLQAACGVALGLAGATEAKDDLLGLLQASRNRPERVPGLSVGLALLGDTRLQEMLLDLAGARQARGVATPTRLAALAILGWLRLPRAAPALAALVNRTGDPDVVRGAAARALGGAIGAARPRARPAMTRGLALFVLPPSVFLPGGGGILSHL